MTTNYQSQYWQGQSVEAFDAYGTRTWRKAYVTQPSPYPQGGCDGAYVQWTDRKLEMWDSQGGWQPANCIHGI